MEINNGYDLILLVMLLSVSLPNTYVGSILAILIFLIKILKKIKIPKQVYRIYFYILILLCIYTFSFFINYSHLQNLIWGLFTFSSFMLFPLIIKYKNSNQKFKNTIKRFLMIQIIFYLGELMYLINKFNSINIFKVSMAAGDFLSGTSIGNSHQMAITMAFISFYFLEEYFQSKNKKDLVWYIITLILFILPSMVSAIYIYILTLISVVMLKYFVNIFIKFKINKKDIKILLFSVLCILIFGLTQINNVIYGYNLISKALSNDPPRKIVGIYNTLFQFSREKAHIPIIGVGIGNYSSRAALIVGGEYLWNQPKWIPPTPSKFTQKYIIPLWNRKLTAIKYEDGIANQPFVQYQSVYAESGGIGIIIFITIILKACFIRKNYKVKYLNYLICVFTMGIFFIDNWIEYPNFALCFWLFTTHRIAIDEESDKIESIVSS